jgi:hypothetical protein
LNSRELLRGDVNSGFASLFDAQAHTEEYAGKKARGPRSEWRAGGSMSGTAGSGPEKKIENNLKTMQ